MSALYDSSEKKKKKKLDEFDQIAQNLKKYIQSASQDEFLDYHIMKLHDIEKIIIFK
jgi:hypothetical protein